MDQKTSKSNTSNRTLGGCASLEDLAYLRLQDVLKLFPVSKSAWWLGVREGKYPASVKLGPRTTAWRVEDIRQLLEDGPTR